MVFNDGFGKREIAFANQKYSIFSFKWDGWFDVSFHFCLFGRSIVVSGVIIL